MVIVGLVRDGLARIALAVEKLKDAAHVPAPGLIEQIAGIGGGKDTDAGQRTDNHILRNREGLTGELDGLRVEGLRHEHLVPDKEKVAPGEPRRCGGRHQITARSSLIESDDPHHALGVSRGVAGPVQEMSLRPEEIGAAGANCPRPRGRTR